VVPGLVADVLIGVLVNRDMKTAANISEHIGS
jgi:hypothetical protein